jgi:ribosomal-protein-serine acetyltransferase
MVTAIRAATPALPAAPAPWQAPQPLPARFDSPRLTLRFWREEDAQGLLEAISEDRRSFLPWFNSFRADYRTLGECHYQILRLQRQSTGPDAREYIIGAFDRRSGAAVGGTGFYQLDRESHQAEIGYWLRPSRRGEGLAAEMVRALITWSFLPASRGWGLRRLEIFCAASNRASRRIPERLGLRQEYHARAARWLEGIGWDDTLGWAVLAEEWNCQTHSLRALPRRAP